MRLLIEEDPFPLDVQKLPWSDRGQWPCHWISVPGNPETPFIALYRLRFHVEKPEVVRIHITADERYILRLEGREVGRGSDRGDNEHWFFETYELELTAGEHVLLAQTWALGEISPFAQFSPAPGFLLCPQTSEWQERIGTGKAAWEVAILAGYDYTHPMTAWGTGHKLKLAALNIDWPVLAGEGSGWGAAEIGPRGMAEGVNDRAQIHILRPSRLPAMLRQLRREGIVVRHVSDPGDAPTNTVPIRAADDLVSEHEDWIRLVAGEGSVTIPPHTRRRVLLDMGDYVCAYPEMALSGGIDATARIYWQESLYTTAEGKEKGNRDEIEGKFFNTIWHNREGVGDVFVADGRPRRFTTLWWHAGRYVEIYVETQSKPLTVDALEFYETHYPYEFTTTFEARDTRLTEIVPIMRRVLEMCSHETYMDCPYFEQLQYVGDTRLQVLATYTQTLDDRLPRKAIEMFDASRMLSGLTQSRYPCRITQIIPPFSLWYVAMVHDFALWRGDLSFVRSKMLGVRTVLDAYRAKIDADGLLGGMDGWNFVDWVPTWDAGMPKDAVAGKSGILNFHLVMTLRMAADLEEWLGEPEMAARHRRTANEVATATNERFWSEARGLYANDLAHTEFSEHAQCLALLAGAVPDERRSRMVGGLVSDVSLDRTTIYFSHYLFETYRLIGRIDLMLERMSLWFEHPGNGLKTTIEMPEPTRSDCHAWGAHPLFHYQATILGVRPVKPGFTRVEIRPQVGPIGAALGTMETPLGSLTVSCEDGTGYVRLPDGMTGELILADRTVPLSGGETAF